MPIFQRPINIQESYIHAKRWQVNIHTNDRKGVKNQNQSKIADHSANHFNISTLNDYPTVITYVACK